MAKASSWVLVALLFSALMVSAGIQRASAQAPAQPLATAEFNEDPNLRCEILEVKRVSGGALNIRWRLVNGAGQPGGLAATGGKPIRYDFSWEQLYYIDPAENKKYQFLTDSGGNRIVNVFYGQLQPGQQRANWAKFPAPPPTSSKISIYIPHFPPFEDIPVSQ